MSELTPSGSFDEVQFPPDIAYGATGGPEFNTSVVVAKSGAESRNENWSESRIVFDVSTGVKEPEQTTRLITFFRNRRGRKRGFRFKDWSDYEAENQPLGTGDGAETAFQLQKLYDDGVVYSLRDIKKPIGDTVLVFVDGAPLEFEDGYTLDSTTGLVEFDVAPGNGSVLTWSGEFDIPARFDTDQLKVQAVDKNLFVAESIPVIELRV
jgi:uncharacterized protein (TIGR02217 family)